MKQININTLYEKVGGVLDLMTVGGIKRGLIRREIVYI